MVRSWMLASLLCACPSLSVVAAETSDNCSTDSVVMVIDGVTLDSDQIATYTSALVLSGLPQNAGARYITDPQPLRTLEGVRKDNHVTVLVDFPSECAALAFWNSPTYQNEILPLRKTAGDYTIELYRQR